jgi:L-lactate dehydrogenase complex protein LldF
VKINIPHLLLKLRHLVTEGGNGRRDSRSLVEQALMKGYYFTVRDRRTFALAHKLGSFAMRLFARNGRIRSFPLPPLSAWTEQRDFPSLAPKTFHEIWQERVSKE